MEEEEDDELSLSRYVQQNSATNEPHNSTILVEDNRSQSSPNDGLVKLADVLTLFSKGQSDTAQTLEKVATILEEQKGRKRRSEEKDTDEVVMVEKTINIKDDGHEQIDHKVIT